VSPGAGHARSGQHRCLAGECRVSLRPEDRQVDMVGVYDSIPIWPSTMPRTSPTARVWRRTGSTVPRGGGGVHTRRARGRPRRGSTSCSAREQPSRRATAIRRHAVASSVLKERRGCPTRRWATRSLRSSLRRVSSRDTTSAAAETDRDYGFTTKQPTIPGRDL
jgi:hypothetical protein